MPLLVELRRTSRFAYPTFCGLICLAGKRNLVPQLRQINPTGKSPRNLSSPSRKNISLNLKNKSSA
jgi:hypothetical protein